MQIINFKEARLERQFYCPLIDNGLLAVVYFMASYAWAKWKHSITITEVWRDRGLGDVHALWRAVDVRNRDFGHDQCIELANAVNQFAVYDPSRSEKKACLVYEIDKEREHDDHFHVQVHPRTEFML